MMPSSKKQRQLIAIGCNQVGISADMRHDLLTERFDVASSTALTKEQADEFLKELQGKGFAIRSKRPKKQSQRPHAPNIVNLASTAEHAKIQALSHLIDWRLKDGFNRWLTKRFDLDRVKTAGQAYKVIEGLKKMFENQMKKNHGGRWHLQRHDDPAVMRYIREHKR